MQQNENKVGPHERLRLCAEPSIISNVSVSSFLELDRQVRQREISVQTLAALLLETIAKDNLFDAVLDEAPYKPMLLQAEEVNG